MNAGAITENRCSQLARARALDPLSIKVDGRNNRDRLAFVAAFSQLILYYDQKNQLAGNWQSFFMKDPSILLAAISKTDYSFFYSEFMLLAQGKLKSIAGEADYVNRLVPLLQNLFATINQWFYFMGLNARANSLYIFLKKMIEEKLAGQLSLMVALQQRMCIATKGMVVAPDTAFYRAFEPVWFKEQNNPLGLFLTDENLLCTIRLLANNYSHIFHSVFDVFVQIIEHATQAFYQQESQATTPYPDTALLMAFSRLMETQQNEINQFGGKHLDFYYDRILHQCLRPAQEDQVFVCLKLVDKAQPLTLFAGTLFKAGIYPDQSEILFGNNTDIEINHAAISSVSTLYYDRTCPDARILYLNSITNPAQVSRNPLEEIVTWDGFGNTNGLPIQQGFALASPMLFLQGGLRTITITLAFESDSPPLLPPAALIDFIQSFQRNQFYLSTEKAWFPLSQGHVKIIPVSNCVEIIITLSPDAPAIVAFTKNPDGFNSTWPLLKIMLGSSINLIAPPILTNVSIKVQVEQFGHFSLANDISPLPNTGPQQIFGPVPEVGDCFYIGSNECFAKPLSSLTLNINWDKLPVDFSDYYDQYNLYLFTQSAVITALVNKAVTAAETAVNDAAIAATVAKGTSAEAAASAAENASQVALTAVTAVLTAIEAMTKGATNTDPATAVSTAAAATVAAATTAAVSKTTAEGTKAAAATTSAATTAEAVAIATALLAFNNTAFMGQWSLLAAKHWQVLNAGITPSTFQPVKQAPALPAFKQFLRWGVPSILHLPTIVPSKLRQILTLVLPSKKHTEVQSSVLALSQTEVSVPVPVPVADPVPDSVQTAVIVGAVPLFQQSSEPTRSNLPASTFNFVFNPMCTPTPDLALSPLPGLNDANNGYFRFVLEQPCYAFGNSLYAQVISYISFENAKTLVQQPEKPLKHPKHCKYPKPIPNPPYSPKLSTLQGSYTACAVTEILPNANTDPQAYPLELYHYGSFKPYLAYDATAREEGYGFCNLTPQDCAADGAAAALHLFAGVGGQGCLYVSLSGVVAPCTLTLYAEISADENQASSEDGSIGYYYWTNTGWQPIKVLRNDTNNLTCSGIIAFDIPSLTPADYQLTPAQQRLTPLQQIKIEQAEIDMSYLPSPIMASADFWLAIATKSKSKSTSKNINFKLSYLDTQAVKLTRVSTVGLPSGYIPQIDANKISATQNKLVQIANVVQPFPSFGGLPAENKNSYGGFTSFYRRVSERLNNKDRSVASIDFVDMAHGACINLFFAKTIMEKRGVVRIGLVNGYANAQLPNAFRPVVDAVDQAAIVKHIASRTSAMTKLSVFNLKHQVVKISTTLFIASQANANAIEQTINQQLRVYLSPWIRSDLPQRNVNEGLNRSALIHFLSAQAGVVSVSTLSVMICVEVDNDDESVLVSHKQHAITLVTAAGDQA